ncbi:TPA: lysozyme [Burkholderia cepacia]
MRAIVLVAAAGAAVAAVYAARAAASSDPSASDTSGDGGTGMDWFNSTFGGSSDAAGSDAPILDTSTGGATSATQISDAGVQAIMQREGFSATPYRDANGYSIGYGHFIKPGESFTSIDQSTGQALLMQDIASAQQAVASSVTVPLTQNQFDALVSFVYNIGVGAFRSSTLLAQLNAGNYSAVGTQMRRWNLSVGVVNAALVTRRESEIQQFYA